MTYLVANIEEDTLTSILETVKQLSIEIKSIKIENKALRSMVERLNQLHLLNQ